MQRVRRRSQSDHIADHLRELGCTVDQINRHMVEMEQVSQKRDKEHTQREHELQKPGLFRHWHGTEN
jgi:hypothetical protein